MPETVVQKDPSGASPLPSGVPLGDGKGFSSDVKASDVEVTLDTDTDGGPRKKLQKVGGHY